MYHKIMKLSFLNFIEKTLARARYEYDPSVKRWVAWVEGFPGVYAQGKNVERVRQELGLILEEYLLLGIREGKRIPAFIFPTKLHAKTS